MRHLGARGQVKAIESNKFKAPDESKLEKEFLKKIVKKVSQRI